MNNINEEKRQALIADCQLNISILERDVTRLEKYDDHFSLKAMKSQLARQMLALSALTAPKPEPEAFYLYREHNPSNGMKTDWVEVDKEQYGMLLEITDRETSEFRIGYSAPPAPKEVGFEGYMLAFYEIAKILEIPAQPYSPKTVFENVIKPMLIDLKEQAIALTALRADEEQEPAFNAGVRALIDCLDDCGDARQGLRLALRAYRAEVLRLNKGEHK